MANAISSLKFGSWAYVFTTPYATCSAAAFTQAKVATTADLEWVHSNAWGLKHSLFILISEVDVIENLKPISIKDYQITSWEDGKGNPLNAANLNHIENGIAHVTSVANDLNINVNTLNTNIKNLKLSDMNDTTDIVILDGGEGKPTTTQEN